MKNMIKVLVLAVAMITFNVSTYAQKSERQRMTREQLAELILLPMRWRWMIRQPSSL